MEEDVDSTSSFLSYRFCAHKKTPYIADDVRNIWCGISIVIVPDS